MTRTLTARWVFPIAGSPLEGGLVVIRDDKIEAVEPRGTRAADDDLGNVAIIPGLVNPHTHLDLSGARGLIPPTDPEHFTDWLKGVIAFRKARSAEQVQVDIRAGLTECMWYGTTLIGDITSGGTSYANICNTPVRAVLFWEVIGLTYERFNNSLEERDRRAGTSWISEEPATEPRTPTCRWATSPHAPYSAKHDSTLAQLMFGNSAIHLAESPAEVEFLASRTGPIIPFLQELGVWEPAAFEAELCQFLISRPNAVSPRLLIHCNFLPPDAPFAPTHSVVYCPRTHAAFGHPPHPFREFLKRGVRVCLGTDSLASNPDLDILAEARFVHAKYPDFPADQLLKMVTLAGAEALGWADECGSLSPGKSADLVTVPLPDRDGDPYELLLTDPRTDGRRTMFRGEWRE
jgi:cytosine/adenosine deaminase-related metal-dependent hydrolase